MTGPPEDDVSTSGLVEVPGELEVAASSRSLWSRLRRKDTAAFEAVVRQHQAQVFNFCFRMVGDREEANDLTQEIFVSVLQHMSSFRQDAKLTTWLFRIAKNHCLNRLKYLKRRNRGRATETEDGEALVSQAASRERAPDEALIAARERARVQKAVSELPEDQRLLVALRDIEGLSYDEIMEVTELPEGTVKSRLHRARERLAELLDEEGGR